MTSSTRRLTLRAESEQEASSPEEPSSTAATGPIPGPNACRRIAHRRMAQSMTKIVDALGTKAEQGSVQHTSLLARLGGFDPRYMARPRRRRRKSLAHRLFEQIEEHQANGAEGPDHNSPGRRPGLHADRRVEG